MCRLCELVKEPDTDVLYESDVMIIMDGMKKDVYAKKWLCIWKEHKEELTAEELKSMINTLLFVRSMMPGIHDIVIGLYSIPEHFHVHLGQIE